MYQRTSSRWTEYISPKHWLQCHKQRPKSTMFLVFDENAYTIWACILENKSTCKHKTFSHRRVSKPLVWSAGVVHPDLWQGLAMAPNSCHASPHPDPSAGHLLHHGLHHVQTVTVRAEVALPPLCPVANCCSLLFVLAQFSSPPPPVHAYEPAPPGDPTPLSASWTVLPSQAGLKLNLKVLPLSPGRQFWCKRSDIYCNQYIV